VSGDKPPLSLADFCEMPVGVLTGVGPKKVAALAQLDIESLYDLLTHYPRRYIDRTNEARIAELVDGVEGMVLVEVRRSDIRRLKGRRTMTTVDVFDATGSLRLSFFNQPWRAKQLSAGQQAVIFGKPEDYRGRPQMTNPIVDLVGDKTGRIVPMYPQSEKAGVASWDLASWVAESLRRSASRGFAEPIPEAVRNQYKLISRGEAFQGIHTPENMTDVDNARKRLVFDELFRIQVALVMRKRAIERSSVGVEHIVGGELVDRFIDLLPFGFTGAQSRALGDILGDLGVSPPMHRLLQGDVGSGKTVVAVAALLAAIQGGHQGALMAPTEVLAEQHYLGIRGLIEGLTVPDDRDQSSLLGDRPLGLALLTNRTTKAERTRLAEDLQAGTVDLLIGTHALIQESVEFRSLGLVVIDEQHRFGVEQRAALRNKGAGETVPDVLVMTATPIPRTAAMTVYGDLDVSVIDEMPPGRTPIETQWIQTVREGDDLPDVDPEEADQAEEAVWQHVREQVAAGRQIYVVTPLIEESEKLEVASAGETFDRLSNVELRECSVALLHGRLTPAEKEQVMDLFRSGDLDVLVATTVIEVGVDVPNATVMVILDADRFGIAQLHQLRGRVGRGGGASWCFLLAAGSTPDARTRLQALVDSTDGFELAEVDLELRGEGTIMGERQKGRSDLKLASLRRDRYWVEQARAAAFDTVDADPELDAHGVLADEIDALLGSGEAEFLMKS